MLSALPYVAWASLVVVAWVAAMAYFEVFTSADVRAWRRLAAMRGYSTARSPFEKAVRNAKIVKRLQEELHLGRLLAIAAVPETPIGFLGHLAFVSFSVLVGALIGDILFRMWQGDWFLGVGPGICLAAGAIWFLIGIARLRRLARHRQTKADASLGDSLMLVGIMTDGRGLQMEDAVKILSRCVDDDSLETIVDNHGYRRLVQGQFASTIDLYSAIGDAYELPMFGQVADAAANTQIGIAERDMYTRLAKSVYAHRLAEARERAARAKTLVSIPVAGMLIPLLILLGAPLIASITGGLGAHS